ncbi:MAG: hypothetical protein K0S46_1149 [Moraxellaceae bacterium]|jgi:hypothetical protein|nr:hypothetical protein [Moraxellaceae bacterium]
MNRKYLWIGIGVLGLTVLAAMGWQAWQGFRGMLLGEADKRALVLPVAALADYGVTPTCGEPCAHFASRRQGTALEISYEYDDAKAADAPLYVSSVALLDWNPLAAYQNYWTYRGGFHLGMMGSGGEVTVEEVAVNPMTLGERRYWARIRNGSNVVGEMVLVQQGRVVLAYVIVGLKFEDPADLESLLQPVVRKAAALQASP